MLTTENEMALVECSEEHISVCKRPAEITSIPPDSYGCWEGQYEYRGKQLFAKKFEFEFLNLSIYFLGSCYELHHEHRTFTSAQSACQDAGGNLISIIDRYVICTYVIISK